MNDAIPWRRRLGDRVADAYAAEPNAVAVLIAGSVGRGTADRYSDLEIDVYYDRAPTEAERVAAVRRSGGELIALDQDDMEFEEQFSFDGFTVTTSTFLVSTMQACLDRVTTRGEIDLRAQTRISSAQHGIAVTGQSLIDAWRVQAEHYPNRLKHAMWDEYLPTLAAFGPTEAMLAEREDLLLLYRRMTAAQRAVVGALLGLNRIYAPTPDHDKGTAEIIGSMRHAPAHLARRMRSALLCAPTDGVRRLGEVIDDVFTVIRDAEPDGDNTGYQVAAASRSRQAWDEPPQWW